MDATWGWDETFQRACFEEHFDRRSLQIIRVEGADAGFLSFETRADHVYLANIARLPPHQGRGIGGEVARLLIGQADAAGLPVRLQVLRSNPARRFYERPGFRCCGGTQTHFQMIRERSAP